MYPLIHWNGSTGLLTVTLLNERDGSVVTGASLKLTLKTAKGSSGVTVLDDVDVEETETLGTYEKIIEYNVMTLPDYRYFADLVAVKDQNRGKIEDLEIMNKRNTGRP